MATYVIGDVQGCYEELLYLLAELNFDRARDRLWFTGDLVNRGPQSLAVLRYVRQLGDTAVTVLGNHDLHLLAVAEGVGKLHDNDTLDEILAAPDRDELLHWLRGLTLLHHDAEGNYIMINAGLAQQWDLALAQQCAAEVEAVLRSDDYVEFLQNMYGNTPDRWSTDLSGWARLRFITNCFTRLRYCDADGHLQLKYKGEPDTQPAGVMPWYQAPGRPPHRGHILFGHWSTLGLYRHQGVIALDTGCVWGGLLTAIRLEDQAIYSYDCAGYQAIHS